MQFEVYFDKLSHLVLRFQFIIINFTFSDVSKCKLELGLVVDTTKSIKEENIPKLQAALKHLVQRFDISPNETHVSFQTFAKETTLHTTFNNPAYHSKEAILRLISRPMPLSKPTRLDVALKTTNEQMFGDDGGPRHGVQKALVLYTDGRSHPETEEFYMDVIAIKVRLKGNNIQRPSIS